tara:strand:+ start:23 stop:799 length:777 start_codon:yes stop_codon:yes gene_type:complete
MFSPFSFMGTQTAPPAEYLFNIDFTSGGSYPGTGTNFYDLSNDYTGSILNTPTYNSITGSFTFNGTNQRMTIPHNSLMDYVGNTDIDLTLVAWAKNTQTAANDTELFQKGFSTTVGPGDARGPGNYSMNRKNSTLNYFTSIAVGTTNGIDATENVFRVASNVWQTGSWLNIVVNYHYNADNNQTTGSVYVNNVLQTLSPTDYFEGYATPNTASFVIASTLFPTNHWKGDIAVLQGIKTNWTATEVNDYWNSTKSRFGL